MSWIVENKTTFSYKNQFPNRFILISTPKCGGNTLERLLTENGYSLSRPKGLDLTGHLTLADTFLRVSESKYSKITDYLIPIRDTVLWRKSFYQYVKFQPKDSGMYVLSNIFNQIQFEDYIRMLVEGYFDNLNSINNLAVMPKKAYISNKISDKFSIQDINIYIYNMTYGFTELFNNFFKINLSEEIFVNSSKTKDSSFLSNDLKQRLITFDNCDFINEKPYYLLNDY